MLQSSSAQSPSGARPNIETSFHDETPQDVRNALESARNSGQRVRVFYGDVLTGRCWNDEWQTIGTISRSTGPRRIPLLIAKSNSMGGCALLDHCIVAIHTAPGMASYENPLFHTGIWTIEHATTDGYAIAVHCNGKPHAQFKRVDQAEPYIAFMKGERWSKAPARNSQAKERAR